MKLLRFITPLAGTLLLVSTGLLLAVELSADESETGSISCPAPDELEPVLHYGDFQWYYTKEQMARKYTSVYNSGKRLLDRARWNENTLTYELVYQSSVSRRAVPITSTFIDSVRSHIERGLRLGYFRHVFFPDMGHAHLLIHERFYEEVIRPIPAALQHQVYIQSLAHPQTRFLYHTAEQLDMLDDNNELKSDKYLGWRYFTRNLVGRNNVSGVLDIQHNLESLANTVCSVPSAHRYWSAGFHISASKDGCFSYEHGGKTYHFDISLRDLPIKGGALDSIAQGGPATEDGSSAMPSSHMWGAHGCFD